MTREFLEQESLDANKRNRKLYFSLFAVFACASAFLYFATRNSLDLNEPTDRKLVITFCILAGIMLFCTVWRLLLAIRSAKDGKNLTLPFKENTKEAVAGIINREAAEREIWLEEFMNYNTIKQNYKRIILLPSYLLLIEHLGRITAIPRDKIYWICAHVYGRSDRFYVDLLVFTENQIFEFGGNDVEHTKEIAEKLYQYIPNVFGNYNPQEIAYPLKKLFKEDHKAFLQFYKEEKSNLNAE